MDVIFLTWRMQVSLSESARTVLLWMVEVQFRHFLHTYSDFCFESLSLFISNFWPAKRKQNIFQKPVRNYHLSDIHLKEQ